MKGYFFIVLVVLPQFVFSQVELPYKIGEVTEYAVNFGAIKVGSASLEVVKDTVLKNKLAFNMVGKGKTAPFFDFFFKVRDVYETFIDKETLLPLVFNRDVNEGGHLINQHYNFYHKDTNVVTQDSTFALAYDAQDMLSALFYARTFNKDSLIDGNSFYIPIFMDDENYLLEIKYLNNELVKTKWGLLDCMVFQPKMQEGRVFEKGEQMKVWITDDKNHLLFKVEAKIWAGTIKAVLNGYKDLKYPLSITAE